MRALGVDTSNYATSLAVVDGRTREVVCAHKRFLPVPQGQAGLRQSDAVFHHTAALPALLGELAREGALAGVGAVGVSERPRPVEGSYMPCFLAGVSAAVAFAAALGTEPQRTSHQQGHIAAALHGAGWQGRTGPMLLFHVSGGTTELLRIEGSEVLGVEAQSLDLYAGQAVDRLGVRLGMGFPAGAELSALALGCEERVTPKTSLKGRDCHLSGLQNQCERLLAEGRAPAYVAKFCLLSIAETLCEMVRRTRKAVGDLPLLCAGGVLSSALVRPYMERRLPGTGFAPPELSSDNAVGVALIAADAAMGGEDG